MAAPRALVTGGTGFAGAYLVRALAADGVDVVATTHGDPRGIPLEDAHARVEHLDVTDSAATAALVAREQPDEVYHLAGLTRPAAHDVQGFHRVNYLGCLNVLEAVAAHAPSARVLQVGSGYAYGRCERPSREGDELRPVNHYGASKAAAELLAQSYAVRGIRVVIARPFNHSGPGQPPDFVLPTLVQQATVIIDGSAPPVMRLGNLDAIRDFADVRDIVDGYRRMLERGEPGRAYNLGSGTGRSVAQLVELVTAVAGIDVEVISERARQRPDDLPLLVADVSRARDELGWEPTIPLEQTVADMLAHSGVVRAAG